MINLLTTNFDQFLNFSQVIEIYDLNDTYAENKEEINYCRQLMTCGKCILDPKCGFCFNSDDVKNTGRCLPVSSFDSLRSLNNTMCANGSDEDINLFFSTTNCPTDWGPYVLVTLCLFLFW